MTLLITRKIHYSLCIVDYGLSALQTRVGGGTVKGREQLARIPKRARISCNSNNKNVHRFDASALNR